MACFRWLRHAHDTEKRLLFYTREMWIPYFLLYPEQAMGEHELQRARWSPITDPQGIFCFSPHSLEAFTITVTLCSSRAEQMQSKGPGGRILSICARELMGLTHRRWQYSCLCRSWLWPCAFNNQEEKLPPLHTAGGLMQVTHEWRQLFHTWLAEGTVCVSGEQGEEGMGEGGGGKKTEQWNLKLSLNHSQHQLDVNVVHFRDFAF